jgi:hypothetical protein
MAEPLVEDPERVLMERLRDNVAILYTRISKVFPRQNRWRVRDLEAKVNRMDRFSGTQIHLAVMALVKDGKIDWDDEGYLRAKDEKLKFHYGFYGDTSS